MANFLPFKAYILETLDEVIETHGLTDPFLDAGCGRGDVAAHLGRRGWGGCAIDASPDAVRMARSALQRFPRIEVREGSVESEEGPEFKTVVMLDVLEHTPDDQGLLRAAAARLGRGGWLVLTVPTNGEREWRWDDDFYGHLRRYRPDDLRQLLHAIGYRVVEMWDVSFPVFWLMRRGFTALKPAPRLSGTAWERTTRSVAVNAWDLGLVSRVLSWSAPWKPIFALQRRYRHRVDRGNEVLVLAERV